MLFYKLAFIFLSDASILVNINSQVGRACEVPVHTMKAYSGSVGAEVYIYSILTLPLDGGEESTSCPSHFTHRKKHQ